MRLRRRADRAGQERPPTFTELVFSDFERYGSTRATSWFQVLSRSLPLTGMLASIIVRAQQCLYRSGHVRLSWVLRTVGIVLVGADFAPGMQAGKGLYLPHPVGICIGKGLVVGNNVLIAQGVSIGLRTGDPTATAEFPTICDDVSVWAHATIVGGVRIGVGAQIVANSLIITDVPDYAIMVGVPARQMGEVRRPAQGQPSDGPSSGDGDV